MNCASVYSKRTCPQVKQAVYSASFRNRAQCTERNYTQATTCQMLKDTCCPYCTGTIGIPEDWIRKLSLIPAKTGCCGQKVDCLLGREDCSNTKLPPFLIWLSSASETLWGVKINWEFYQTKILYWKNILYPKICPKVQESKQDQPQGRSLT